MKELLDKAIAHITDEATKINEQLITMIEEHLTNICTNVAVAQKLLNKDKTLEELSKNIWDEARKRKKGNGAHIPDVEIFKMAEKYYEITEEDKNSTIRQEKESAQIKTNKKIINIMDLI